MNGLCHLPRDLIIEILSRIPVKTLCKLRSVSKSWRQLLTSDKEFIARQTEWSKQSAPLVLLRRYLTGGVDELNCNKITVEFTSLDLNGELTDRFEQTLDGPVHSYVSCGALSVLCCTHSLYVCNPGARQIARVPCHGNSRLGIIGFGYLPSSNEYKVVRLFHGSRTGNGKMGCEIFSFRRGEHVVSGSWKRIGDCPFTAWTDEYPVCVNGVIYFSLSAGWKDRSILSLDLEREEFARIGYPIQESKDYSFLGYIGLTGALCVVGFSPETSKMDVWTLKKNKNWVMESSINLRPFRPKFLIYADDRSEEIVVQMEKGDLICYRLGSEKSDKIGYYSTMKIYSKPCLYYGSLIPLHASDQIDICLSMN